MDGAGKSTTTNALQEMFKKSLVKSSLIYTGRGRANILPIQAVGRSYKKVEARAKIFKPIKKIIYTCAAPVFALDLFIRYWLVIWPKRKTKHLVMTDRYSSDMLLMVNVPDFMRKLLYFFLPKPTFTIYLWNKPEVLNKRKQHPLKDLQRQEKLFAKINRKIKPVKIKSQKPDQTLAEAAKTIFKRL